MSSALSHYETRKVREEARAKSLASRSDRIGNLRGLAFVIGAAALGARFGEGNSLWTFVSLVSFGAFFALVVFHGRVIEERECADRLVHVLDRAIRRANGRFTELEGNGANLARPDHPYAHDLDLFGPGSLYQRLSIAHTRMGEKRLVETLSRFAPEEECLERQPAVRELSEAIDFRIDLEAEGLALAQKRKQGRFVLAESPDPEPLLSFIEETRGISDARWLSPVAILLPLLTIGLGIAHLYLPGFEFFWVVPWVLGVALLGMFGKRTSLVFGAVSATEGAFLRYAKILRFIENFDAKSNLLATGRKKLSNESGEKTSKLLDKFQSLIGYFELRHSGLVYPAINSVLLWDIHMTLLLEAWRRPIGPRAREWFEVIGEWEALASLSTLLEEKSASFPTFVAPEAGFSATKLGHPLVPENRRITNDVAAFRPGEALLVTGSNMSGKSTFLRAIGVNLVLAFAGAPVVAKTFSVMPCELGTSLRISDSLQSGVSHFYAEVKKLATVVGTHHENRPVFFLLDEILHGTNSRERTIGARWVIAELLEKKALGVVTTHDEKLAELSPEMQTRIRQHHFRESVENGEMAFDYALREGPVKSGNALRLMRLVGLEVPLD